MARSKRSPAPEAVSADSPEAYASLTGEIAALLAEARRQAARSVNAILTATYWEIGHRIVEFEQRGERRAGYGDELLERLAIDLSGRLGRGFGFRNLNRMRAFFLAYTPEIVSSILSRRAGSAQILSTLSAESATGTPALQEMRNEMGERLAQLSHAFPLSWSHYTRLLSVKSDAAREFYEAEALRGGWSIRQLDRQISTLFYERTALSRDKAAMLTKGAQPKPEDAVTIEEEIKDPYVLEFLGLKDEYSETELEEALIRHLESFLLELGNDFTFVARQKRIRVGDEWYRIDLLLFHRRLRCLVLIDLKAGKFSHADAGQMNLYVNYASERLTLPDENPPVGLILCSETNAAVAHYALGNILNTVVATEYRLALPPAAELEAEVARTRRLLEAPSRKRATDEGDDR